MQSRCFLVLPIIVTLYGACVANAAEPTLNQDAVPASVPDSKEDWALQITPYLWAAEMHGRISPFRRGPTIGVGKSFSDVLEDLRVGGFVDIWGRKGRYVLSGDIAYVDTKEGHTSGPLPGLGPLPPGTRVDGSINSKLFTATLQGGYRVVDTPTLTLDALLGLRAWHVSNKVQVSALRRSRSYKESFGWTEPVIGARAFTQLTDRISLQGLANIGGFGAGSKFVWSAQATLNYVFTDKLSVSAGYKVLDVNYRHKGNVYDTRMHGPVLGLTYRF